MYVAHYQEGCEVRSPLLVRPDGYGCAQRKYSFAGWWYLPPTIRAPDVSSLPALCNLAGPLERALSFDPTTLSILSRPFGLRIIDTQLQSHSACQRSSPYFLDPSNSPPPPSCRPHELPLEMDRRLQSDLTSIRPADRDPPSPARHNLHPPTRLLYCVGSSWVGQIQESLCDRRIYDSHFLL